MMMMGEWCKETNGFDCAQEERNTTLLMVDAGPQFRKTTGLKEYPERCFLMDLIEFSDKGKRSVDFLVSFCLI